MKCLLHTLEKLPHQHINAISTESTLTGIHLSNDGLSFSHQVQTRKVCYDNRTTNL